MADFQQPPPQNQPIYERPTTDPFKTIRPEAPLSTSRLLALLTLLPIGAFLLFLAGISFAGTVIGLAITSPLFLIFSPILIPAALVIAVAVAGFLTSGAFGVTALSSLSWIANYFRRSRLPLNLDQAKQWVRETAAQAAQTAKEAGQAIQSKAQDGVKAEEVGPAQEGQRTEQVSPSKEGGKTEQVSPAQEGGRTEEPSPAQEGGRAEKDATPQEDRTAQEQGTAKEEAAQEPVKAQESGKAQSKGKAQGGKARGGGKT